MKNLIANGWEKIVYFLIGFELSQIFFSKGPILNSILIVIAFVILLLVEKFADLNVKKRIEELTLIQFSIPFFGAFVLMFLLHLK